MSIAPVFLDDVLLRPDIWRGDRLATLGAETVTSSFPPLDAELPGGGWPRGALIEILPTARGIGEISLLLPALQNFAGEEGGMAASAPAPIAIVAPPGMAHAPAWATQFPLAQLLI